MGALQKIRSKSTFLVAVIAVGLLAFVIPWGEITQSLNIAKDKAFVVNGDVVKTGQFQKRVEQRELYQKLLSGTSTLDENTSNQIREEVYLQMVKEMALDEESDKLGLNVTVGEMKNMVYSPNMNELSVFLLQCPLFMNPQTRQFDRLGLDQFLTELNKETKTPNPQMEEFAEVWAYIEHMIKYTCLEQKYASLVAGSVLVNDIEAKAYHNDSKDVASISYVSEPYSSIDDSTLQVSDSEVKALYDARKKNFLSKMTTRQVMYLVKEVVPSDADYNMVQKEIEKAYERLKTDENPGAVVTDYSSEYMDAYLAVNSLPYEVKNFVEKSTVGDVQTPIRNEQSYVTYKYVDKMIGSDSIQIQVLPIQVLDPARTAVLVDSLYDVVKRGKNIAQLATEMYPGNEGLGTPTWVTEAALAKSDIANECFAASKGAILKVDLGGQKAIINVLDKTRPVAKAKIAYIQMPVIISDKTQSLVDNELNKFLTENAKNVDFATVAENSGYDVVKDMTISQSDFGLAQIASTRNIIRWAFNENVGEVKKFDFIDKRIIAKVIGETKEGYIPVNNKDVNQYLRTELIKEKKAEKIKAQMKAKNATSLELLAEALDSKVESAQFVTFQTNNISGVGYEPILNVYAKAGTVDAISEPMAGNNAVFVMSVTEKNEDTSEYNAEQVKGAIQRNYAYLLANQASAALIDKMDVEDNRIIVW